jgi:hypothetical protein
VLDASFWSAAIRRRFFPASLFGDAFFLKHRQGDFYENGAESPHSKKNL